MSRVYPLDAVETARRAEVSSQQTALAERVRDEEARALAVAQHRANLDALDGEITAQRVADRAVMGELHSAAQAVARRDWSLHQQAKRRALAATLDEAEAALRDAEKTTAAARERLAAAKAELESVLRHRDGWERAGARAEERKAESVLDEAAIRAARPRRVS